jgi:RNA polymerase sigma-70 factor (ECF subfamily)
VLAIARLRALTALAAKRRHRHVRGPELGWLEDTGHAELTLVWSAERDARVVRELVTALPEGPEKDTVALAYLEGEASAREIALQLGVGKSAVCMRLQRFRRRVRTQLSARLVSARGE